MAASLCQFVELPVFALLSLPLFPSIHFLLSYPFHPFSALFFCCWVRGASAGVLVGSKHFAKFAKGSLRLWWHQILASTTFFLPLQSSIRRSRRILVALVSWDAWLASIFIKFQVFPVIWNEWMRRNLPLFDCYVFPYLHRCCLSFFFPSPTAPLSFSLLLLMANHFQLCVAHVSIYLAIEKHSIILRAAVCQLSVLASPPLDAWFNYVHYGLMLHP